ncbi:MAG: hypothetical protein JW757_12100 [Anaerolineales bacterium]|nr:hypothetical protein [Anaerolineales bacterium]
MFKNLELLGALCAIWIYSFSILVFVTRLIDKPKLESTFGILSLLSGIPLGYLLITAPQHNREPLYYIQVGLMLVWIIIEIVIDYILKLNFRQNMRWVIPYVMLFFAGTGGMLGVASLAGTGWMVTAVVIFLLMAGLTFYQRAKTGK